MDINIINDILTIILEKTISNFAIAINNNDKRTLLEFKNAPERLFLILLYLRIPMDILATPAYRQLLEEELCSFIDALISNQCSVCDTTKRLPDFFKIELGSSRFVTASFSIQSTNQYLHIIEYSSSHNLSKTKKITLETDKRRILIEESSTVSSPTRDLYKNNVTTSRTSTGMILDTNGFTTRFTKKEAKSVTKISRDGRNITPNNIPWNGNPLYLTTTECSDDDIAKNIIATIRRCPDTKDYYTNIYGEKLIKEILETMQEKN